jgi:hypothetical protein
MLDVRKRLAGTTVSGLMAISALLLVCQWAVAADPDPAEKDPNVVPATEQPVAKYACEQDTVTPEPVWVGKKIQATWTIRNEGTADLRIKLKGG